MEQFLKNASDSGRFRSRPRIISVELTEYLKPPILQCVEHQFWILAHPTNEFQVLIGNQPRGIHKAEFIGLLTYAGAPLKHRTESSL